MSSRPRLRTELRFYQQQGCYQYFHFHALLPGAIFLQHGFMLRIAARKATFDEKTEINEAHCTISGSLTCVFVRN